MGYPRQAPRRMENQHGNRTRQTHTESMLRSPDGVKACGSSTNVTASLMLEEVRQMGS